MFLSSLRLAIRPILRRGKLPAVLAAFTLSLGFGLAIVTFGTGYALFLNPLPYPSSSRLVHIGETTAIAPLSTTTGSNFWRFAKDNSRSFEALGAWRMGTATIETRNVSRSVVFAEASKELEEIIGLKVAHGRLIAQEEVETQELVPCLITRQVAQQLGLNLESLDGAALSLDGLAVRVVGVHEGEFNLPGVSPPDIWLPLERRLRLFQRVGVSIGLNVIGRTKPEVSISSARGEIEALHERYRTASGTAKAGAGVAVNPLPNWIYRRSVRPLVLIGAIASILLLMALFNAASICSAAGASRLHEMAVRLALGADSTHIRRLAVANALLVTLPAAAIGVGLATLTGNVVHDFLGLETKPDATGAGIPELAVGVLLALISTAALTAIFLVMWRRVSIRPSFDRGGASRWFGHAILPAQVSISIIGLCSTFLLVQNLVELLRIDPGFVPENVAVVRVAAPRSHYRDAAAIRLLYVRLEEALGRLPQVRAAALASPPPLDGMSSSQPVALAHSGDDRKASVQDVAITYGTAGLVSVLQARVVDGSAAALAPGPGVQEEWVYVNSSLARNLGHKPPRRTLVHLAQDPVGTSRTVSAVFSDVRQKSLHLETGPHLILPISIDSPSTFAVLVRTQGEGGPALKDIERAILQIAPGVTIQDSITLSDRLRKEYSSKLVQSGVFTAITIVVVFMVILSASGIVRTFIRENSRQLGIRLAMGATAAGLRARFALRVFLVWFAGAVGGLFLSISVWRLIQSVVSDLPQVTVHAMLLATLVTMIGTIGSAWLGSSPMKRLDPAALLRSE